ncbi:hypothetical protein [Halorussus pelagicus]|uniref:hypothetical protein n=1 Tax=Halorussus pelagicus TaxID=2505977 RepID=UPI001AA02DB3|nr:hypothetical protein [Halorussus pelagicus]
MVSRTRRHLLHGAVGLLVGFAGCSDSTERTATRVSDHSSGRPTGAVPDHFALRRSEEEPTVLVPSEDQRDTTTAPSSDQPPDAARRRGVVASAETADRLWVADVDGAAEARQFVADTDFDGETIYVEYHSVRECHSLELCSVTWSETEIDTSYGSYYRDPDTSCRAEAKDGVSWLIRIPEALDPEAIRGHGSGWSSSGCRPRRRPDDETTTDRPDFGPKRTTDGTGTTTDSTGTATNSTGTGTNGTETTTEGNR